MKKDQVKGMLFILPEKNKEIETHDNKQALSDNTALDVAEKRKEQDLIDVQIKLKKVGELQKRLKELLETLAAKLEKCK